MVIILLVKWAISFHRHYGKLDILENALIPMTSQISPSNSLANRIAND